MLNDEWKQTLHGIARLLEFMNERVIFISLKHILNAAHNKEYCDALAFALSIKAAHRNSMLLNYSWRKIMSLCHCNLDKAKKLRDNAMDFGLIRITEDGKHIIANKLHNAANKKHDWCMSFYVHDDGNEKRISLCKYKYGKSHQTLKYTSNLILYAAIANNINGYNRQLNTWQTRATEQRLKALRKDIADGNCIRKKRYDVDELGLTTPMPNERGYSHASMLEHIFGNSIGLNKLKSLLKGMKKEGMMRIHRNRVHHITIKYGDYLEFEHCRPIINHETGERKFRHIHTRKVSSKKEVKGEYDEFFRPMPNKYDTTGIYVVRKTSGAKNRRKTHTPSFVCSIILFDSIPF